MEAWTIGPWVGHMAFTVKGMAVMRPPLLMACSQDTFPDNNAAWNNQTVDSLADSLHSINSIEHSQQANYNQNAQNQNVHEELCDEFCTHTILCYDFVPCCQPCTRLPAQMLPCGPCNDKLNSLNRHQAATSEWSSRTQEVHAILLGTTK